MYQTLLQATPLFGDRQLSVLPFYDQSDLLKSQIAFNKRRIVVAQLPYNTSESDLRDHFQLFGEIEKTFVVCNQNDKTLLPYGHVIYFNEKSASKARNFQNHFILGKKVSVTVHKINVQKKLGSEHAEINNQEELMHFISRPPVNPKQGTNNYVPVRRDRVKKPQQSIHNDNTVRRRDVRKQFDQAQNHQSMQLACPPSLNYNQRSKIYSRKTLYQAISLSEDIDKFNHYDQNLKIKKTKKQRTKTKLSKRSTIGYTIEKTSSLENLVDRDFENYRNSQSEARIGQDLYDQTVITTYPSFFSHDLLLNPKK